MIDDYAPAPPRILMLGGKALVAEDELPVIRDAASYCKTGGADCTAPEANGYCRAHNLKKPISPTPTHPASGAIPATSVWPTTGKDALGDFPKPRKDRIEEHAEKMRERVKKSVAAKRVKKAEARAAEKESAPKTSQELKSVTTLMDEWLKERNADAVAQARHQSYDAVLEDMQARKLAALRRSAPDDEIAEIVQVIEITRKWRDL